MSPKSNWKIVKDRITLSEEDRQMYASEKGDNFRWAAQLLGSYSPVALTAKDLVPVEVQDDIRDIGQFAELIYSPVPIELLLQHVDALDAPGFPLEAHDGLRDAALENFYHGSVAKLPVAMFHRPSRNQVVITLAGTTNVQHVLQDLRFLKTRHPSGHGNVHSGFWAMYTGIAEQAKADLRKALEVHNPAEIAITGHSMGGSVAYLLCIDILSEGEFSSLPTVKLITFGSPRVGDQSFVAHFRNLAKAYRAKHGEQSFIEYAVRGHNDGVPLLPPKRLGFYHFAEKPLYSAYGQLYNILPSQAEYSAFRIDGDGANPTIFPRGGHNYYNGREQEKLVRRLSWLEKAKFPEEGWEARYKSIADKS